ncbi:MAG: methyl-accepting chemotaxis protein [Planctomycetes bacterium]|nr:methyl-accepting chemotaxis protein [Planctomycetota bacterium]
MAEPQHHDLIARRRILVDKKFQLQYLYIWLWVGVGMVLMSLLFYALGERVLGDRRFDPRIVRLMSAMSGFLVLFCVLMGVLSVFLTHRVAGAAYRLERCIRDLAKGDYGQKIALRSSDYLQNLAEALNVLQAELRGQVEDGRRLVPSLEQLRDRLEKAGTLTPAERTVLEEAVQAVRGTPALDKNPPAAV